MRYFRRLAGSFHNPATYSEMRYGVQGWGLVYALFIVAITTLVGVLWLTAYFHSAVMNGRDGRQPLAKELLTQIAAQWPEMVIENNQITQVNATMPYRIRVKGEIFGEQFDDDFMTIDTTGQTTHANMPTKILITRDEIITKDSNNKKELRSISDFVKPADQPLVVDRAKIMQSANELYTVLDASMWIFYVFFIPIVWGIMTGIFFIGRVVMLLALGVVAMILGNLGSPRIDYMGSVRLASIAYTPVAILTAIGFGMTLSTPSTLVLFALGALMIFVAAYVTKPEGHA